MVTHGGHNGCHSRKIQHQKFYTSFYTNNINFKLSDFFLEFSQFLCSAITDETDKFHYNTIT